MFSTAETDAEDVNDFLKRIQELGTKRDQEDEERNRKLEEEILQGRKERQARRAERARSISPTKDSPANTPSATDRAVQSRVTLSPPPDLQPTAEVMVEDKIIGIAMESLGEQSPTKEKAIASTESELSHTETVLQRMNSVKGSPSAAMPPSRISPLSWQRRPGSQASDQPRSRPLSAIAMENAARSPGATPEPIPQNDGQALTSRDQIAQMLGSKDASWFRQTADRGENSPAYRKSQVEDVDVVEVVPSSRVQLPGMSRELDKSSGSVSSGSIDIDRSTSPPRSSLSIGTLERNLSVRIGSPMPLSTAQRFDPPTNTAPDDTVGSRRTLAMSPSQGRISPERGDRPTSPTKGIGGFVQSAMMKRSDSVSKRWSVQSPPGLSRGNSIVSNRSSADPTLSQGSGGLLGREPHPGSFSQENSPLPQSRPTSSHSNARIAQDSERPTTSSSSSRSLKTVSTANDGLAKPTQPTNRSQLPLGTKEGDADTPGDIQSETTPPASPAKLVDARRWSPTKSSWLESALNKPESPKPKLAPPPPQQPAWMSEISKAKQRNNVESTQNPPVHKHEVNIGGLLRSPPPGGLTKSPSIGFPVSFSPGTVARKNSSTGDIPATTNQVKASSSESLQSAVANKSENTRPTTPSTPKGTVSKSNNQSCSGSKPKPENPPMKDFRANLKPRQLPSDNSGKEELEFKNVFGQLRRTKTQNYVAPDELKDNILRGKAGLNVTGGPKKTERKDEFKEAILKKKDDFKKAQLEGTGVTRSASSSSSQKAAAPLPEAIVKKAALGKTNTIMTRDTLSSNDPNPSTPGVTSKQTVIKEPTLPSLHKEVSATGRVQSKEAAGGTLADRFNPALASLLARRPPSAASDTSQSSSPMQSLRTVSTSTRTTDPDDTESGPQLTHMTKSRARGPRRKAPSTLTTSVQAPKVTEAAEQTKPAVVPSQMLAQENLSPIGKKMPVVVPVVAGDKPENGGSQPTSPRKLDIKRRSRFLEEVSNQNEKTLEQVETPKPLSQTKKASIERPPATKHGQMSQTSDRKVTPSTRPKPPALTSSAATGEQATTTDLEQKPPKATDTAPPTASLLSNNVTKSISPANIPHRPQLVESAGDANSVVSVKKSADLFNRQTAGENTGQPAGVKTPIKLPTQVDEKAAMLHSGPGSPGLGSAKATTIAVPVGKSLDVLSTTVEVKPDSVMPQPPQKTTSTTAVAENSTPSVSPPLPAGLKPGSPKKIINQTVPHSSEASKLIVDFFGKKNFVPNSNIDTAAILSARSDDPLKIQMLRSQLFQLSGDGKKQQVPNHQERLLFENNMYICPHTFVTPTGKKVVEVYFWVGDGVAESSIEDAVLFAQREAKIAGGKLVKLRQGQETPEFIEALGGIMITRRGSSNKYDSLSPHILCGRRYAGQIVFDEVDFSPLSLCSGFPYLISTQSGKCYLWKGKGSGVDELSCARLIGMDFGLTGELEEIEDGMEPASFPKIFGNDTKILKSADHWRLKPKYPKYAARLFCADPGSKSQIIEIHSFTQSSLSSSKIYILDAFFEIYVIVGSHSQAQYAAFCTALLFAQEYGILAAGSEDRPFVPVSTVVLEGVPRDLKAVFRKWKDGVGPTMRPLAEREMGTGKLQRGKSLRVVPLNAVLDAARF